MITTLPFFLDTSSFTAIFVAKHRPKMAGSGVLPLRHWGRDDSLLEVEDRPILAEWRSAAAVLKRIRNEAAKLFNGQAPELGLAWIDHLTPDDTTPWTREEGDYAEDVVRLRICMIPCPQAFTFSGAQSAVLAVGTVNIVEHRQPCSEINLGPASRTHLVVDLRRPVPEEPA